MSPRRKSIPLARASSIMDAPAPAALLGSLFFSRSGAIQIFRKQDNHSHPLTLLLSIGKYSRQNFTKSETRRSSQLLGDSSSRKFQRNCHGTSPPVHPNLDFSTWKRHVVVNRSLRNIHFEPEFRSGIRTLRPVFEHSFDVTAVPSSLERS